MVDLDITISLAIITTFTVGTYFNEFLHLMDERVFDAFINEMVIAYL